MSDWIISTITEWGYVGIFMLMVAENVFPPIPSELIMPFAGFAAANGQLNGLGVLLAGSAGSLFGTMLWYFAARLLGLKRFHALCNKLGRVATITERDIDMAVDWFARYGVWAVLIGRLIPAIRTLISVPAGLAAMPFWKFLGISAIGTLAWTAILTGAGYVLHEGYHIVEAWVDPVSTGVVVLAVVIYIYRFVTWKPIKDIG
ncbi:DedA family protein [Pelagibacterium luteolum]|uniref:Membrane protein DedA, SNARE-associated domain n=1 Tax=Pelagibacterium luteolum TaxID=440168 RepID=A0A1G7RU88_9HYPH|nr:DedA family protein [Pelagibacterium luteolum]SDG13749.1 membrane protein DedA, SNARE-associated domain [Pelagibacterium luteolum]